MENLFLTHQDRNDATTLCYHKKSRQLTPHNHKNLITRHINGNKVYLYLNEGSKIPHLWYFADYKK